MKDTTATTQPTRSRLGDLWGGLAAALVAFPSSIAFGVVVFSAVGPERAAAGAMAGIVGAAALGLVSPLVGRSAGLIAAPCAPAAAVLSAVAIDLGKGGVPAERVLALLAVTTVLAAVLQVGYGAVKAGRLIKFIPSQVVSGYLSGVALIIASAQIPKLLGVPKGVGALSALIHPVLWQWPGVVVGGVTIAVMVLGPRLTARVPGAILGLAAGVAAYGALGLADPALWSLENNSLVIGPLRASGAFLDSVSERLHGLAVFEWGDLSLVVGPALTLSVLLSIDTLKTGVVLDALTRQRSSSNRVLVGVGVANAVSFLAGGLPGAGTSGPTLVNVASGGASVRSGVVEGVVVVFILVALGPLVAWVPIGALAGILLVIAWRMVDLKMFSLLGNASTRLDFVVIAAVVAVAEGVGLIQASAVGVVLAILLFIRDEVRGSVIWRKMDLTSIRSKRLRSPAEDILLHQAGAQAVVVQLRGNLFFGTTDQLFTELEEDLGRARFILLDLRRVRSIDYTAAKLLKQMHERLAERQGALLLSGMPSAAPTGRSIESYLRELELVGDDHGIRVFLTRDSALEWLESGLLKAAGYAAAESQLLELRALRLLGALPPTALAQLTPIARERRVAAGDRVFRSGDGGDELFFVRRGRVHVLLPLSAGNEHHLATFGQGEFFGEMAFLDRTARSADAEAAVDTDLFAISRAAFDEATHKDPALSAPIFEHLALGIAQRLRVTDGELRVLEER